MPTHFYWGNDEYAIAWAVDRLRQQVVDRAWQDFNFTKISASADSQIIEGLTLAITTPFGNGGRLTWLSDCPIGKKCAEEVLTYLERCLANLPPESHLVFSHADKPDSRCRAVKLLQQYGDIKEFSLLAPWQEEAIIKLVADVAKGYEIGLPAETIEFLAEAIGNDTRRLHQEMQKIKLWMGDSPKPPSIEELQQLVTASGHNTLQLGQAIRQGNTDRSFLLLQELLANNEPPLRIIATLVGQFRTWLQVRAMVEAGEKDEKKIAELAELGNPKRVYFLKKEVQSLSSHQLFTSLQILLEAEVALKTGATEILTLQTTIMRLCQTLTAGTERQGTNTRG
ncbi:MAG: DNA polymerase III subunit delta [Pseudanabaenaceae cyanobacterium SKYGB_i_bin29]|nr:DNA polymerase III subunit delta [Pseudanabaenaceae cyanobacterium SKYG29]MDW8421480.1 DNA polymerase III subunit delta [Pseudanabaenaceae cyanobacterium SKYGB_i_bin29]